MRRAAKVDANQYEIVDGLRAIGASVYVIKEPVDLLVGFRNRTVVMEVKNEDGKDLLTDSQRNFFENFRGESYVVYNLEDAIRALIFDKDANTLIALNKKKTCSS